MRDGRRNDSLEAPGNMAGEIHCAVENTDDLKCGPLKAEENHMPALRRDLATGKKIIPETPFSG